MPTLREVAQKAGVSVSTASLVLRETDGRIPVTEETRRKVLAAAAEADYRPHIAARRLRQGKSQLIGLLLSSSVQPAPLAKMNSIAQKIRQRGYQALTYLCDDDASQALLALEELEAHRAEGVVMVYWAEPRERILEGLRRLAAQGTFVVALESLPGADFDCVTVDRHYGVYLAARYLLNLGHRRIGIISGPLSVPTNLARRSAYLEALEEGNLPPDESLMRWDLSGFASALDAVHELLSSPRPPTAIICGNDRMALAALKAARQRGLQVPADLSVVGFDDVSFGDVIFSEIADVPLTSIAQPIEQVGQETVRLLFGRIQRKVVGKPRTILLKPTLSVRESCAPPGRDNGEPLSLRPSEHSGGDGNQR